MSRTLVRAKSHAIFFKYFQIFEFFDYLNYYVSLVTGLYSWQSSTNVIYEDSVTDINLDDYINCHKDNLYKASMNFTLPLTEQTVSLKVC